jgi:pimeloyl-ACP methyl ester carboxylesterase
MNKQLKQLLMLPALGLAMSLVAALVSAEEVTIKPSELKLNAELSLVTESISDGPLVLLVHGTLAHNGMEIIGSLQELLADEDLNSLAINLSLGVDDRHGAYDCTVPHQHLHEDATPELSAWIEWLKGQGVKHIILAGHSRGGSQVAAYSQRADTSVVGQVLIAPMTWNPEYAATTYQARYQLSLGEQLKVANKQVSNGWMPGATSFIYCENAAKVSAASFLSYYQPSQTHNTPDLITDGGIPTVLIAASEDQVIKDLPKQMQNLNFSNLDFITVDGADHYFRDLYADDVAEAILGLIESVGE